MWTPKRIMLLAGSFVVITLVYLVYAMTSLGRINTLPPLPEKWKINSPTEQMESGWVGRRLSPLERKLEMAFRPGCVELKWPVLLELNSRSMAMAAGDFKPAEDGRVLLAPMSLAIFGKKKNDGKDPEINTLRCKQAFITFDQPVYSLSPSELNGRKVVAAELFGDADTPIVIENNRRTPAHEDDLTVTINTGPLHYNEKKQFIWTSDVVHLRDGWLEPPRANIIAKGMEMELATSAPPAKPGAPIAAKPKTESISGVKRIVLKQDVTMHLHIARGAPFPGGDKDRPTAEDKNAPATKTAADKPDEPSNVIIRTPGRFQYDLFKDHDMARFDVPDENLSRNPQDVTVERVTREPGKDEDKYLYDQLVCKHLELRVKRHSNEATPSGKTAPAAPSTEQGLEIETAHATGPYVTLTSDAEKLDAHGNDFFYDAGKKLSILKGAPRMEATKEESLIQAPEMRIQDIPLPVPPGSPPKTYQQVQATGPGDIYLTNKTTDKTTSKKSTHASWEKQLISTREGELDLLVLTGAACFEDKEQNQSLKAETINVWLLAEEAKPATTAKKAETKTAATAKAPASPQQSRRPHHIEALRNVKSHSPQVDIPSAGRLVVRFTDVPADRMPPPSAGQKNAKEQARPQPPGPAPAPPASGGRTPPVDTPANGKRPPPVDTPASGERPPAVIVNKGPTPPARQQPAMPPQEPDRPIKLTARSIEADVLRCGERMALDHLWADGGQDLKGGVVVQQAPAKSGEHGVYIKGNTLNMQCTPEGNILDVIGDLAQLEMGKMIIIGPEVNINQATNHAQVRGRGAMQMESDQTLDGKPLGRSVPLKIHWGQEMLFFGEFAEFYGDIEAAQENARMFCQSLQVSFDRPISLKEGVRGDQSAKVRNLVGDKDVRVEDASYVNNRLEKYQRMEGIAIAMNTVPRDDDPPPSSPPKMGGDKGKGKSNDANDVTLSGPGSVRLMQRGGSDLLAAPGQPAPNRPAATSQATPGRSATANKPADEPEMKLTYIRFERLMKASTAKNTASFWGKVQVLNFPCKEEDMHRAIDLDAATIEKLPEGGMYLRCNQLKARTYKRGEKTFQEMDADGLVLVRAKEFFAQADHMTFNEEKDQVILTGDRDRPAVLQKRTAQGQVPQTFRYKKLIYIRKTGDVKADDGDSIDG